MEIGTLRKFLCTLSIGVALLLGLAVQTEAQRRRHREGNWGYRNYGQMVSASRHRRNRLRQSARRRLRLQRRIYNVRLGRHRRQMRLAESRRFRQRQRWWAGVQRGRAARFRTRQQWWARTLESRRARFRRRQALGRRLQRRQQMVALRHSRRAYGRSRRD